MTSNVWLVIFLKRITREASLHLPIHNGFIIFTDWKMSYKEGTFIYDIYVNFTVWTFPHFISETKAFLCCKIICISSSHSEVEREVLLRSMYWIRIWSSVMFLLGSLGSSHRYLSELTTRLTCLFWLQLHMPWSGLGWLEACECRDKLYCKVECLMW